MANAAQAVADRATGAVVETVIDCRDLVAELNWFRDELGCRIQLVTPADDPREYVVEHPATGGRFRLRRAAADIPATLRLPAVDGDERLVTSPGGTVVDLVVSATGVGRDMAVPAAAESLVVAGGDDGSFGVGRAGMTYRDLLPDRWGGRFIASHIRIDEGGDVDDWVHFHRIRFQMIYVAAGWVDVVYEDQGEPFRMEAGDCVLQPPTIRHRVLRSSPGLEVVEVGCPAEHDTISDPDLSLPTGVTRSDRDFGGQRFVRHVAAGASWTAWVDPDSGVVHRDTGIGDATSGLAGAVVVRPAAGLGTWFEHDGELLLLVGLSGHAELTVGDSAVPLAPRGSVALPSGSTWSWSTADDDHEALVVSLPATSVSLVALD